MKLNSRVTWYFKKIDFLFDWYFVYFLYSPRKKYRYHRYMLDKWGDIYKKRLYDVQ